MCPKCFHKTTDSKKACHFNQKTKQVQQPLKQVNKSVIIACNLYLYYSQKAFERIWPLYNPLCIFSYEIILGEDKERPVDGETVVFGWDGVVQSHGSSPFYRPGGLALSLLLSAHLLRHVFRLIHVSRSGIINPSFHRRSQLYSILLTANRLEEYLTRFAQSCLLRSVKKLFVIKKMKQTKTMFYKTQSCLSEGCMSFSKPCILFLEVFCHVSLDKDHEILLKCPEMTLPNLRLLNVKFRQTPSHFPQCADGVRLVIPVTLGLCSITVNVVFYHHILPHLSHSPAPTSLSLSLSLSAPMLPLPHTHTHTHTHTMGNQDIGKLVTMEMYFTFYNVLVRVAYHLVCQMMI